MCLYVSEPRKIDFIYKVLNRCSKLYSPLFDYQYIVGDNYPEIPFEYEIKIIDNEPKVKRKGNYYDFWGYRISIGVLHAYTSQHNISGIIRDNLCVIVKLPIIKEDIVAFGSNNDIALKKIHIPQELYKRIISYDKPNENEFISEIDTLIPVYWQ